MIESEDFCDPEWAEWYLMTPEERWGESQRMWQTYLALGGTFDPEPDPQSPFFNEEEWLMGGRRACCDAEKVAQRFPEHRRALESERALLRLAQAEEMASALKEEEQLEPARDQDYWRPLKLRLEEPRRLK